MRRLPRATVLLILVSLGRSRAYIGAQPPSARILVNGRVVGVGSATIPTEKGKVVIVRAELDGFRPACAVVENRRDQRIQLARAMPGDPPEPTDAEVRQAWDTQRANLCAERAAHDVPPTVIVTQGDISRPYEVLGEVQIDTTGESTSGAVAKDVLLNGALFAAIRPEPKGDSAAMLEQLKTAALAKYGAHVDAVINANVSEVGRDVFVRGLAVHFVDHATGAAPTASVRSISERLGELDRLGASGMLTPEEYKARRKAILEDL